MKAYKDWAPTGHDTRGLALDDKQDWLVAPVIRTRDSDCLEESNYACARRLLAKADVEGEDWEDHRFGHWACGWLEIILVRPGSACAAVAACLETELKEGYCALDEDDWIERETTAAQDTWRDCYTDHLRIEYMRDYRTEFEFHSFADMLACARGKFFNGDVCRLLGS